MLYPGGLSYRDGGFDPDAWNYFKSVEAVDGERLEEDTRKAITRFVKELKSKSLWDKINSSCIWGVSRTLAGGLIALKGDDPEIKAGTSITYTRKLGMRNNTISGGIDLKYADDINDPNGTHAAFYTTYTVAAGTGRNLAHSSNGTYLFDSSTLFRITTGAGSLRQFTISGETTPMFVSLQQGELRVNNDTRYLTWTPPTPTNWTYGAVANPCGSFCGFYSLGSGINAPLLWDIVADLFNDINLAIT